MELNKKVIWVVVVVAIGIIAGVSTVALQNNAKKQAEQKARQIARQEKVEEAIAYKSIGEVLKDFHASLGELSPSVDGKKLLGEELGKMKKKAKYARSKLSEVKDGVKLNSDTHQDLIETFVRTDKYIEGYEKLANLEIGKDVLVAKAKSMLDWSEKVRNQPNANPEIEEGDLKEAIFHCLKVADRFKLASQPPKASSSTSSPTVIIVRGAYVPRYDYQSSTHDSINDVIARALSRSLGEDDLRGLSSRELTLVRNGIFAVYGRMFKRPELQNYFDGQGWYIGRYEPNSFNTNRMSRVAKRNADFIGQFQNNYGLNW